MGLPLLAKDRPCQRCAAHCLLPVLDCFLEVRMKTLPNYLIVMAAVGTAIGLAVRLAQSANGAMRPAFLDPVFYWRGAMALLMFAVSVLLIQIRNK